MATFCLTGWEKQHSSGSFGFHIFLKMFFYFFIFFLIIAVLFVARTEERYSKLFFIFLAIIFILIAGLKTVGVDMDSTTYVGMFSVFGSPFNYFKDYENNSFLEPGYYLIPSFITYTLSLKVLWVFLVFAVVGVSLKLLAITKLTDFTFLSALIYYSHYFILHEMTQIRAGIAAGILLLCIVQIQKKYFPKFLLLLIAGIFFHYSIVIFLPFYFLNSKQLNKVGYLALLIVPYVFVILNINILTVLQTFRLGVFSEKIEMYNNLTNSGILDTIKIYSVVFLAQLVLCAAFILKSDLLVKQNKYALLIIKINAVGLASLVFFSVIPVIAIRISELLRVVEIILIPFILYLIKPKYVGLLVVVGYALFMISINLLYLPILKPYFGNPTNWQW